MNLQHLIQQYLTYQRSLGWRPPSHGGHLGKFGRFIGDKTDIADVRPKRVLAFLAGDGGDFISGQTLWVDGGLFSHPIWPYPVGS